MKTFLHSLAVAAALASAATLVPTAAVAAGHGGSHGFSGGGRSFGGSGFHGAPLHGRGGYYRGGYYRGGGWGHRGYWGPGVFWGGIGLGLGLGAVGYYNGYYAPSPYYRGYYYDAPEMIVDPGYAVVEPAAVRSGQPVPQSARAAEPIFYPKDGQSAATAESDRRDCNRWATTQNGAMADASIFQRATLACMEGRGYTAR